jgi:hypothetical protein
MRSKESTDSLDFDRDLPTTAADVEALRRVRQIPSGLPGWREVELLVAALPPAAREQSRETCEGWEPFEL